MQGTADALVLLITARGYGADGRGLYSLCTLTVALGGLIIGGISAPLAAHVAHRRTALARLNAASVLIAAAGAGPVGLALVAVGLATGEAYLLFAGLVLPFFSLMYFQAALFQACGEVLLYGWLYAAMSLSAAAALGLSAAFVPGGINLALAVWAVSQALVPTLTLLKQRRDEGFNWTRMKATCSALLRRGAPVSIGNALQKLNYRVDVFVVAVLLPLAAVGRYSVAVAAGEALWQLSRAIITAAYPQIIQSDNDRSVEVTLRAFRHSAVFLTLGGLASVGFLFGLGGPLLGAEFSDTWILLALLLPGVIGLGIGEVLRPFLLVRLERSREFLIASGIGMLLNLALAIALVPWLGLEGAAISTSVAYIISSIYMLERFAGLGHQRGASAYLPGRAELADYRQLLQRGLEVFRRRRYPPPPDRAS